MKRFLIILAVLFLLPGIVQAAELSWKDNATNEKGFEVERKVVACGAAGTFAKIGSTAQDVQAYSDTTTQIGYQYCYRVRAFNTQFFDGGAFQFSDYSNEAGIAYPLGVPSAAPSQLNAAP